MQKEHNWFAPNHPEEIASPALLVYPHRIAHNIEKLIEVAGDRKRLRPHVKTHKLPQVVAMHQAQGIEKLKCATIAEVEMLALCGVADILLAYQPVGPTQQRLITLAQTHRGSQFGCLLDNERTLAELAAKMNGADFVLNVWIDIDNGNGRSGIQPSAAAENLAKRISDTPNLIFAGLHVYDGHFSSYAIDERIAVSNQAYQPVTAMIQNLAAAGLEVPNVVAGGSPTFPVHALRPDVDLSPGTYSLWDMGYSHACPELPFQIAAVLLTRVISKPAPNRLCLDLGHKAVSGDNPIYNRVRFLDAPEAQALSQSEEHLVIELPNAADYQVGDVMYGVPWHICPTVALHQEVLVINEQGDLVDRWPVTARNRRLTV